MNIGIFDINKKELEVGARVVVYSKRFEKTLFYSAEGQFGAPDDNIYIIDRDRPKPMLDVPIGIGEVVYRPGAGAFKVRYEKPVFGISETFLCDDNYHYEILT